MKASCLWQRPCLCKSVQHKKDIQADSSNCRPPWQERSQPIAKRLLMTFSTMHPSASALRSRNRAAGRRTSRRPRRRHIPVLANNPTSQLGHSIRRRHQMRRQGDGRYTSIRHPDIREPVHAEVGVDHAALILGQHGTRRGRVEFCGGFFAHPVRPVLVAFYRGPRRLFLCEAALQWPCVAELARDFQSFTENLEVYPKG